MELVNVYVKTNEGWKLAFENITEEQAQEIWMAGFKTGQNNISIENAETRRINEMNRKALGL